MTDTEWTLEWTSTAEERYDTNMLAKADEVIDTSGVKVLDRFGGVDLVNHEAENGYDIEADADTAHGVAEQLTAAVGHPVHVRKYADDIPDIPADNVIPLTGNRRRRPAPPNNLTARAVAEPPRTP